MRWIVNSLDFMYCITKFVAHCISNNFCNTLLRIVFPVRTYGFTSNSSCFPKHILHGNLVKTNFNYNKTKMYCSRGAKSKGASWRKGSRAEKSNDSEIVISTVWPYWCQAMRLFDRTRFYIFLLFSNLIKENLRFYILSNIVMASALFTVKLGMTATTEH